MLFVFCCVLYALCLCLVEDEDFCGRWMGVADSGPIQGGYQDNLLQHFRRQNLVSGIFVFEKLLWTMSVNLEINIFLMGGSTADVLRI